MRQACREMNAGGIDRYCATWVAVGPYFGQRAPTPGSAKVQAIEVRDLAVAAVADGCRLEQRLGLSLAEPRKKPIEPFLEFFRAQDSSHAFRFHQSRRQKV